MDKHMILIRGLPGAGKTTLGNLIGDCISADDWMTNAAGEYQFDPARLPEVHGKCQALVADKLAAYSARHPVKCVVANTFSQHWEIKPYLDLAAKHGARVTVIDLFDGGLTDAQLAARGVHGVPLATIGAMRARWQVGHAG